MKYLVYSISIAIILVCTTASAGFTPAELQVLPKYCQDKLARKNKSHWKSVFGNNWLHMHHYCGALVSYSKAIMAAPKSRGKTGRGYLLDRAVGDFNYSIRAAISQAAKAPGSKAWPLLPKAHYELANALEAQGKEQEALKNYLEAIKLKKKYPLAYASVSDYYRRLGDLEVAKEYVEKGLKYSPNSKSLKRRKAELISQN